MKNTPTRSINDTYIQQLLDALAKKDKALLIYYLDLFPELDEKTRTRALFEISMTPEDDVFFILNHLLTGCNDNSTYKQTLIDLLLDKARTQSRFVIPFVEHADLQQLKTAIPVLATMLINETDTYVLQKIINALGRTGEKSCINVIADFIFYDHIVLKREAIDALGNIGGISAIKRLAFASQTKKTDEHLIATLERLESKLTLEEPILSDSGNQFTSKTDAMASYADDSDVAQLILLLNSDSPQDNHLAIEGLKEVGASAIPAITRSIDLSNPTAIINGLVILGSIKSETSLPFVLKILNNHHSDPNVRFAVYETISKLPKVQSSVSLIDGISDPSEQVRVAAATAINHNLSDLIVSGILSKLETSGRQSKRAQITSAIIDSLSGEIFNSLLGSDSFVFLALDYLSECHESIITYFSDILIKRGTRSLAGKLSDSLKPRTGESQRQVFCVDDSQIYLNLCTKLFHSMGFSPRTFTRGEDMLTALKTEKPDLITTELDLAGTNGLELSENIRHSYPPAELPIVMITVRNETPVQSDAINLILTKPLDIKTVKQQILNII
jgi:CheY-like chemotaxis protein